MTPASCGHSSGWLCSNCLRQTTAAAVGSHLQYRSSSLVAVARHWRQTVVADAVEILLIGAFVTWRRLKSFVQASVRGLVIESELGLRMEACIVGYHVSHG